MQILDYLLFIIGITTIFNNNTIEITKTKNHEISHLDYDFSDAPDITQTVTVTCFGMWVSCPLHEG